MKINIIKQAVFLLGLCFVFLSINHLAAQNSTYPSELLLASPTDDCTTGKHTTVAIEHIQARHSIGSAAEAELKAGQSIQLQSGFQSAIGTTFRAYIAAVSNNSPTTDLLLREVATTVPSEAIKIDLNNYPNPFQQQTTIEYTLPQSSKVSLRVYNLTGKLQTILLEDKVMEAGFHTMVFDAKDLASGVYLCQLTVANQQMTKKMIIN